MTEIVPAVSPVNYAKGTIRERGREKWKIEKERDAHHGSWGAESEANEENGSSTEILEGFRSNSLFEKINLNNNKRVLIWGSRTLSR